jgi:AraC family transcriptional regulator
VLAGSFICRSERGSCLMSPGALFLGNAGQPYECSHRHGSGDRCLSFQFEPDLFERIASDAGAARATLEGDRLPPLRALAPLSIRAEIAAASARSTDAGSLEEIALELAGTVIRLTGSTLRDMPDDAMRHSGRIARVLRYLEVHSAQPASIADLARIAGLSRFHFLRTFRRVTGITPHQWLMRARLRQAAELLITGAKPITGIALDVGFDDLSNFIRSFRAEFGVSPRRYRATVEKE